MIKICSICGNSKPIELLRKNRRQCWECINKNRKFKYHHDSVYRIGILKNSKRTALKYQEKYKIRKRAYDQKNKLKKQVNHRKWWLKTKYNLTIDQYNILSEAQWGLCRICGKPESIKNRRLVVDHNKNTGKIRSLLCYFCNVNIVSCHTRDSVNQLSEYLALHGE